MCLNKMETLCKNHGFIPSLKTSLEVYSRRMLKWYTIMILSANEECTGSVKGGGHKGATPPPLIGELKIKGK